MELTVIVSIVIFFIVLALIILIRAKYSKFEVKPADLVLALLPIAIFLLVTGRLKTFEFGGLKIESAFVKASESAISAQVTKVRLPTEEVRSYDKMAIMRIPLLIEDKAEGLQFYLGRNHYAGYAIMEYLSSLVKYPFFHYIIIINENGTFFAMADGRTLYNLFSSGKLPFTADNYATWLNTSDKHSLTQIPGLIPFALNEETTDKSQALQKMESLNVDTLPVINKHGKFVGVVNRSRLTASLIIDVSQQLRSK